MQILSLHVISGAFKAADFATLTEVETLGGVMLSVSVDGSSVTFTAEDGGTSATVTEADLMSCAGVVHKIDSILVPGVPENPMLESLAPASAPAVVEAVPEAPEPAFMPLPSALAPEGTNCSSIAEIATGAGDLTTLLKAVEVRGCPPPLSLA
jgi:Fasciclin domain